MPGELSAYQDGPRLLADIGGIIVPRLGDLFTHSPFRARFEPKGRLSGYAARIPTWLITEKYPAFFGVSAILAEQLG